MAPSLPFLEEAGFLPAGGLLARFNGDGRPPTLKLAHIRLFKAALQEWEVRPGLRWVAVTSTGGRTFLAGADFSELAALDPWKAFDFSREGRSLFSAMRASKLWITACPKGACLGGGLDFLLACDYRVAGPEASFGHPGPRLGFFTGWGGTARLPLKGRRGLSALLSGETLPAARALDAGWIEEVAPRPLDRAVLLMKSAGDLDLSRLKALLRVAENPLPTAMHLERAIALARSPSP